MPPVEHYQHVVSWFKDIGPATVGMAGNVPISYTEIRNWVELLDIEISTFEVTALTTMSKQYCYQSYISEDPKCVPPYLTRINDEEMGKIRQNADETIRGLF